MAWQLCLCVCVCVFMIKCCLGAEKRIYDFEDGLATLGHLKWVFETLSSVECMLEKIIQLDFLF